MTAAGSKGRISRPTTPHSIIPVPALRGVRERCSIRFLIVRPLSRVNPLFGHRTRTTERSQLYAALYLSLHLCELIRGLLLAHYTFVEPWRSIQGTLFPSERELEDVEILLVYSRSEGRLRRDGSTSRKSRVQTKSYLECRGKRKHEKRVKTNGIDLASGVLDQL